MLALHALLPPHHSDRSISRSYSEFLKLSEALSITCPQSILPALPLAQTSAATDEEDGRLVKLAFQRWVARVTSDQAVMKDEEMRSFIESDFGVSRVARQRKMEEGIADSSHPPSSTLPGLGARLAPPSTSLAVPDSQGSKTTT